MMNNVLPEPSRTKFYLEPDGREFTDHLRSEGLTIQEFLARRALNPGHARGPNRGMVRKLFALMAFLGSRR